MAEVSILRFPISGKENEYFLLEVSPNGSRPLDLKLIGSESTAVFVTKCKLHPTQPVLRIAARSWHYAVRSDPIRHKRVGDYKAQDGPCSDEEWEGILTSTLVNQDSVSDIEIRAELQPDGESISLLFKKNFQGVTKKVGTIKLEENEKTEISPFDWCVSAIGAREKVQEDLAATIGKVQSAEDSLKELKDQLDEIIKTKEEDETELLEKFRDLLNEKKVKIRQQQRLLASANVDPDKLANIAGGRKKEKHVAQSSRASKRKIKEEPESSDAEFEKMDVEEDDDDGSAQLDVEEDHGDTTADETASGTGTDDDEPAPPPIKTRRTQATIPKQNARASTSAKATRKQSSSGEDSDEPPPRRVLPFMKNKQPSVPPPKPADDDETESEDEL
ncbi:hypothetical protein F4805DRAFT_453991 [Annulohypoxylon moriforme]|nr:hypothetical protein F4805DRAFT_453991 [Annulohypoxylon moriforme]